MRDVLNEYEDSDYRNRIANIESFKELNFNTNYRVLEMGNPLILLEHPFFTNLLEDILLLKLKEYKS